MARITLDFPDAAQSRVLDAFAAHFGWTSSMGTKAAFAKLMLGNYIKGIVKQHEADAAAAVARDAVVSSVDQDLLIT